MVVEEWGLKGHPQVLVYFDREGAGREDAFEEGKKLPWKLVVGQLLYRAGVPYPEKRLGHSHHCALRPYQHGLVANFKNFLGHFQKLK